MKDFFKLLIGLTIVLPVLYVILFQTTWFILLCLLGVTLVIWAVVVFFVCYAALRVGDAVFNGVSKLTGLFGDKE